MNMSLSEFINKPPDYGSLEFRTILTPVSNQAKQIKKEPFIEQLREIVAPVKYLLTGEIQIEIEWWLHERKRYESDHCPDVDNILKPILDAISGPKGLIIDDSQVQSVCCSWLDWSCNDQQLCIKLKFDSDLWIHKDRLIFVHMGNALCFPFFEDWPSKANVVLLDYLIKTINFNQELIGKGIDYYSARHVMPLQRQFHRTRIKGFKVVELDDFRNSLVSRI